MDQLSVGTTVAGVGEPDQSLTTRYLSLCCNHQEIDLMIFRQMSSRKYVLDTSSTWGRIPSSLLDRGSFFSSPAPSEQGEIVDEEYNIEDLQIFSDLQGKIAYVVFPPSIIFLEVFRASQSTLSVDIPQPQDEDQEEKDTQPGHQNLSKTESREVPDQKQFENNNIYQVKVNVTALDIEGCYLHGQIDEQFTREEVKEPKTSHCKDDETLFVDVEESKEKTPDHVLTIKSRKGRRYSVEFKRKVSNHLKSHSIQETAEFFDIPKSSVRRWKSSFGDPLDSQKVLKDPESESIKELKRTPSGRFLAQTLRDKREEALKYLESHTYSQTESKFGVSQSCLQSWNTKRRMSLSISRQVLDGVVTSVTASGNNPRGRKRKNQETVGNGSKKTKMRS